jgi:DNA-binding response OmpR family regulator
MHILVIEDEPKMAGLLRQGLAEEGHHVVVANDGHRGLEIARNREFDVLVLDLMLPGVDGFQITQTLRDDANRTPILMLTARDSDEDIIRGLNIGADDYLTKPFSFDVFLARVRTISRRGPIAAPVCHQVADLVVNTATRDVKRASRDVVLTAREYLLLELLAKESPRVLSRDKIISSIWGLESDISPNNLEVFVHLLRSKIELPGESKLIRTIRGAGYALREDQG